MAIRGRTPIRVLLVTPWFPSLPGDREGNYIFESATSLSRAGMSLSVLVVRPWLTFAISRLGHKAVSARFDPAAFPEFQAVRLTHYASIPRNRLPRLSAWLHDRAVGPALTSLAKTIRADLIHAHTEFEAPIAAQVGRRLGLPTVVTLHGVNTGARYFDSPFLRARFKEGLAAADRVVLVGEPLREHFAELVGDTAKFRVVPNGFNPPLAEPHLAFAEPTGSLRIISISNLHEGKGIDIALRALAKMRTAGVEDWTYTVVGDGPERERLTNIMNDLSLQEKVEFMGACAHDQIYTFLKSADVFVLPSYREAFGIAYLEAMASGLLAIGIESEGPSAFIKHGETGFLVPPRDPDALARQLIQIAGDRPAMRKIAESGRDYVTRNLPWNRHAEKLIDIYGELVPIV